MDSFIGLFDQNQNSNATATGGEPHQDDDNKNFPPEPQAGNVEYKLKIVNPSKHRFEHLVTQMKWRLREGKGEALYEVGVEDNGAVSGLSLQDLTVSLQNLERMAVKLGATTTILRTKQLQNGRNIAKVLVQKMLYEHQSLEIRVVVLGASEAGKSSTLGVLVEGRLDNGRGSARLNMFRHLHEIQSGHTSSISHDFVGFNAQGNSVNNKNTKVLSADEIFETSSKLVTVFDLPGLNKYIHTAIKGLCSYNPHYVMITISSTVGFNSTTVDHLVLANALNIPFFVVMTKIDIRSSGEIFKTLDALFKLANLKRKGRLVKSGQDVCMVLKQKDLIPAFYISNVTGDGLDLLFNYLNLLPQHHVYEDVKQSKKAKPLFNVIETFNVGEKQQVLCGLLIKGVISEGMKMRIGPHQDGSFTRVTIRSIQRFRFSCRILRAGQTAAVSLDRFIEDLRSGMVLVRDDEEVFGTIYFQALTTVLCHATTMYPGYEAMVHATNVRQSAFIVGIFPCNSIHINENESVLFKFKRHPEYLYKGQQILFTDGQSKCTGIVTQIFPNSIKHK